MWFQLGAAIVVTGLILSFVAKPYWVPSSSMEQTLLPGDRVLTNRLAWIGSSPATGDIVVFDAGDSWRLAPEPAPDPIRGILRWIGEVTGFGPSGPHTLVKRVIGGPGQTVACCDDDGRVTVDGEPLDEPYVWNDFPFAAGELDCDSTPRSLRCFDEVAVPEASFLVLGDNRSGSADSAALCRGDEPASGCWRWAERDGMVGKVAVIYWPITRWSIP